MILTILMTPDDSEEEAEETKEVAPEMTTTGETLTETKDVEMVDANKPNPVEPVAGCCRNNRK